METHYLKITIGTNMNKWVCEQTNEELIAMYNDMLPALKHNRRRAFEFADEQEHFIRGILL